MRLNQIGAPARNYLASRNLDDDIIQYFGFGFAPNESEKLITYLETETNIPPALIAKRFNNKDQFYNRLMIPIFDDLERVVGFSGRTLGEGNPKYLNSREDSVFSKKNILYNLNNAKKINSDELIIVEGFFDVISLHRLKIKNVVALMGTAFTKEHIELIRKYKYKTITFLLDQDNAGQSATFEAAEKLLAASFTQIKVISFGKFKDIDELINAASVEQAQVVMKRRKNYFQYRIEMLRSQYNLNDIDEISKFTSQALKFVDTLEEAKRLNIAQLVSQITNVDQAKINEMIEHQKTNKIEHKPTVKVKKQNKSNIKVPTSNVTIIKYALMSKANFEEVNLAVNRGLTIFDKNGSETYSYEEIFTILKNYYKYYDAYDYIDITDFVGNDTELIEELEKIRKEDINKFNFDKVPDFLKTGKKSLAIGNIYFKKRSKK